MSPSPARCGWSGCASCCPTAVLAHITAEHPVNFTDPLAWDFWVHAIRGVLPRAPDVVFSSEPYGDELARRLGARHVAIDPARAQVPISGTQIRAQPMTHWDYIPAPVRPYFARRVALVGAECTGKTTLARALADAFQTVWVPEYARAYLLRQNRPCSPDDLQAIAQGQAELEDERARLANRVLICDTNLLTTQLWHEHYFGACPENLHRLARQRCAALTLLCGLDVPWVADGLRNSPDSRAWFQARFQAELTAQALPWSPLTGSWEQRLNTAIELIRRLVAA